jgi:nitroreductase
MTTLKASLKAYLKSKPEIWKFYWRVKLQFKRVWVLRYFACDIINTFRAMHWDARSSSYRTLSASLLFQYHKLEKGLVMPGPRRLFGIEPAISVIDHLRRWHDAGHSRIDPIYTGALETLQAYRDNIERYQLDTGAVILPRVAAFLAEFPQRAASLTTPQPLAASRKEFEPYEAFRLLTLRRRSVREFLPEPVPAEVLARAVALAQLSPSACNRQPCRVYTISDQTLKAAALAQQNGNRGFGHLAPHVLVITADEAGFFDASERHQPYIDGGLFCMSLALALTAQDVASCCLNWCVPPANDKVIHRLLSIPSSERIVMFMAVGFAPANCKVPQSPRRELRQVLCVPTPKRQ